MITYKVLDKYKKGVIINRAVEVVQDNLTLQFLNARPDMTAIISNKQSDASIYRKLDRLQCVTVPKDFLSGDMRVSLTIMDRKKVHPFIACEELHVQSDSNGYLFVSPNDDNLPEIMAQIQISLQECYTYCQKLEAQYLALNAKLEKTLEGYDIT